MQTIAQRFRSRFETLTRFDNGFTDFHQLVVFRHDVFLTKVRALCEGSGSYDPTYIFEFADGSRLRFCNSRQGAFGANCYLVGADY